MADRRFGRFTRVKDLDAVAPQLRLRGEGERRLRPTPPDERPPSDAARAAAGIVRDAVATMGRGGKPAAGPDHPTRVVVVEAEPHARRGGRRGKTAGPGNHGTVVIAAHLPHVPAGVIALTYRHRRAIEVFCRRARHRAGRAANAAGVLRGADAAAAGGPAPAAA